MKVAVAYADMNRQLVVNVDVSDGATAGDAIQKSGILSKVSQIDLSVNKIGIFSKLVPMEQVVAEGDRVEIYRPALGKPPKKDRSVKTAGDEETQDEA